MVKRDMREPRVQNAIREVLEEARREGQNGLRFSEIKERVERKIGSVTKGALGNSLATLLERGEIDKKLDENGAVIYSLSKQYEKQEFKNIVLRYIEKTPLTDMEVDVEDIPYVVFVSPRQETFHELTGEEKERIREYFVPNWDEPREGIASILLNDFLRLPEDVKGGIVRLLFWSYWAAIQAVHHPGELLREPFIKTIGKSIEFVQKVLKKAENEGNEKRIRLEKSVLEILKITRELFQAESLLQFLSLAEKYNMIVADHERTILEIKGGWTMSGEMIFRDFVRSPGEKIYEHLPLKEPNRMFATSVFNEFCLNIISMFKDIAAEIRGDFEHAKKQIASYAAYLNDLLSLFRKRYFIVVYLFNVPLGRAEDKLYFLPDFEAWLKALREGDLAHRSWVFKEATIKTVEKAYKRVKRGLSPPPEPIDLEHWTLRDIYELHPRGKDERFWLELLELLREGRKELLEDKQT